MTLEQYLRKNYLKDHNNWSIKVNTIKDDHIMIYIHPANNSGETLDLMVKGNDLEVTSHQNVPPTHQREDK